MASRDIDPRLQELFDDDNINVYSISKLNTVDNCEYEAWNTYINKDRGKNGVYGIMGGKTHDKLEQIINNEATEAELLPTLRSELSDLEMLGIDFPKDFKGGNCIKDNWVADMEHFCNNFVKPNGKFTTEELIILKINDKRYLQGYLDLIRHNKDGSISIYDWKTSSQFSKDDLIHHGRQLALYCMAKEQEGFVVKNVAWIMLKYVEVSFVGKARSNSKKETEIVKIINRGKLINELSPYIEKNLEDIGIGEIETEIMLDEARKNNSLNVFPQEIQDKYKIKPYVREYEITDDVKNEALEYVSRMSNLFESKSKDEKEWNHRKFTKTNGKNVEKEDTFFCHVLCNHRDSCKHIKKYDDLRNTKETADDDLF